MPVTGVDAITLPLGCDHASLAACSMPRREARRLLGLPDDRVIVLFVGYLLRKKGVRELAAAILDLGDPFLGVFVGAGPEAGFGGTDPRAHGRLLYQGARPHEDVVRHMSAADVLVLPSYGEGLPTVIVEAGSLGVPVIASAVGGIPELLGEDRGTILPEVSARAVATALSAFVEGRAERRRPRDGCASMFVSTTMSTATRPVSLRTTGRLPATSEHPDGFGRASQDRLCGAARPWKSDWAADRLTPRGERPA